MIIDQIIDFMRLFPVNGILYSQIACAISDTSASASQQILSSRVGALTIPPFGRASFAIAFRPSLFFRWRGLNFSKAFRSMAKCKHACYLFGA